MHTRDGHKPQFVLFLLHDTTGAAHSLQRPLLVSPLTSQHALLFSCSLQDHPVTAGAQISFLCLLNQLPIQRQYCKNPCPTSLSEWAPCQRRQRKKVHDSAVTGQSCNEQRKSSVHWLVVGEIGKVNMWHLWCHTDELA